MEKKYPSDLSDKQWEIVHNFYKHQYGGRGRPPSKRLREIWNAILYMNQGEVSWRKLPKDFPPWRIVYSNLLKLSKSGRYEMIMRALNQDVHLKVSKEASSSVAIDDHQSVKSESPKELG
ncbi:MAG: transposase [Cyanobacteria bacterium J06635_15]